MIDQKDLSQKMSKDIDEMEKMLNDYLQFAKTQAEEYRNIEIGKILKEISSDLNNENLEILFNENIYLKGRPIALKRSFENIIQNGLSYGKKVFVDLKKSSIVH